MTLTSLKTWLRPSDDACFDLLDREALNVQTSVLALAEAMRLANREAYEDLLRTMKDKVVQSLDLNHEIVDQMHRTLVTPLDQEDLLSVAHALKAVVDRIRAISERLVYYRMGAAPTEACELSRLILLGSEAMVRLMGLLRNRKNFPGMAIHIQRIRTIANEADILFRQGLNRVFEELDDPIELIKQKELLEQIKDASNRIEFVAKTVGVAILRNG